MYIVSVTLFLIVQMVQEIFTVEFCEDVKCSHVYDPVCGIVKKADGSAIIRVYQNICHFNKIQCKSKADSEVLQKVPDDFCHLNDRLKTRSRRLEDHSIVGAYQACNHTCPTFCVDTYEPVCAQIWRNDMEKFFFRPMVNHCHVDLVSCTLAVNVTIQALGKCYKNPTGLMFMSQMAALKSMNLLNDVNSITEGSTQQALSNKLNKADNRPFTHKTKFRMG